MTTAYLYPGQGTQRQGMLLDEAADVVMAVWQRAERHSIARWGFSIAQIVAENPHELRIDGELLRHPAGLLQRTEFSQAALAVVAYAQTEQLRAAGRLVDGAWFAGHSLGEYTALACYGQVLELEALIDVVYQRGRVMNQLVERDEQGASDYAMAVLRPDRLGLGDDQVDEYVAVISEQCGEFLQVVNHNLAGAQYAVTGTRAGLAALDADARRRAELNGQRRALLMLPGIDVPFHSQVLRHGVGEFRAALDQLIADDIDCDPLVGRYVPNLVGIPFAMDEQFFDAVAQAAPDAVLPNDGTPRELLIELLAWQFASPVQWIKTQDTLLAAGVDEFIEIGLAESPVLTNLLTATIAQSQRELGDIAAWNLQRDHEQMFR